MTSLCVSSVVWLAGNCCLYWLGLFPVNTRDYTKPNETLWLITKEGYANKYKDVHVWIKCSPGMNLVFLFFVRFTAGLLVPARTLIPSILKPKVLVELMVSLHCMYRGLVTPCCECSWGVGPALSTSVIFLYRSSLGLGRSRARTSSSSRYVLEHQESTIL